MALNKIAWTKHVRPVCIGLSASALAAMAIQVTTTTTAEAKTPGHTYCYYGKCHRVKTIEETQALVGVEEAVTASHYDDCSRDRYNPCGLTSSGERFHPDRPDNTASPIYPDGTTLLVWSPESGRALVVRVNNAGPYWGNRTLDLSKAAAEKLGFAGEGVANVRVRVIKAPEPEETVYSKERNYPPVPGDIGQYANLEDAQRGMAVVLAFQASAASPFAPVTAANAFAGRGIGSDMLVAEAPQALGRLLTTVAYTSNDGHMGSLAFGGFTTQSRAQSSAQSRGQVAMLGAEHEANQTEWDEDRVIESAPEPVTESSAVATGDAKEAAEAQARKDQAAKDKAAAKVAAKEEEAAEETAAAKLAAKEAMAAEKKAAKAKAAEQKVAAANDDEPKPRKKRVARDRDDDDNAEGRRARSRKSVARNEERSRGYDRERVAYSDERYTRSTSQRFASGESGGGRSAGQTMSDNLRPL